MPIDYKNYPANWKTEIVPRILKRAENKCEFCGVENKSIGYRDFEGKFYSYEQIEELLGSKGYDIFCYELSNVGVDQQPITIILTIAHLDHDPENWEVEDDRLAALCQRCHLKYDAPEKKRKKRSTKAIGDLFE